MPHIKTDQISNNQSSDVKSQYADKTVPFHEIRTFWT